MQRAYSRITLLLLMWVFFGAIAPQMSHAQDLTQPGVYDKDGRYDPNNTANRYGDLSNIGNNPYANEDEEPRDTVVKPPKIRKPLESYLFDDSTRTRPNFAWNIDMYRNKIEFTEIDTAMLHFQLDQPYKRKGVGDAVQGSLGGATDPLNYFDRPQYENFNFAEAYNTYYWLPTNVNFYNVKKPFSLFGYLTAGAKKKAEENLHLVHAQNISPSTGFSLAYKSRGTRGMYMRQKTRAKNLSIAFSHTGKKYTVHAGYIYNADINQENGGLFRDAHLTDSIVDLSENLQMRLSDAHNTIKNNSYYIIQSYGVPLRKLEDDDYSIANQSSIFFGHAFEYQRWHKNYKDTRDGTIFEGEEFYDKWFIDPTGTHDSIFESLISNRFFIQIQPWNRDGVVGVIDAGVGMDNHRYYQFFPMDMLEGPKKAVNKSSYYLYGSIEGKIRRYVDWGGDVKISPFGYRNGDMSIGGRLSVRAYIRGRPLTLAAKVSHERRTADYWSTRFFSNHFAWTNSFSKESESRLDVSLTMPAIGLELRAAHTIADNKVYYGADKMPKQSASGINVSSLYARKDFRLGGFNFNHRVLLQWSSNQEVIPVPMASVFISYFFEFNIVKNVLRAQFGVDGRYNTKYYAKGWNPATTTLYNQREREVGAYPTLDVFFAAKWKRMRLLLKMEHLNEDMIGSRTYFSMPHYPQNMRLFKLGFSWGFYD